MSGLDVQKARKLTTYGKTGRQQAFGFKSFLESPPDKHDSQFGTYGAQSKASPSRSPAETIWDLPSRDDKPKERAPPTKPRHAKTSVLQNLKSTTTGSGEAREKTRTAAKVKDTVKQRQHEEAAQRKRKRQDITTSQNEHHASTEKDIFDFPGDDDSVGALPMALPTRSRAKTPLTATTATFASTSRTRIRKSTPKSLPQHLTPLTARKAEQAHDIYDIPDDNDISKRTTPRVIDPVTSPLLARKRQKTPARDAQTEARLISRVRSPATTPQASILRPMGSQNVRRKHFSSPKSSTTNGVVKRKIQKGSSAPASLFSMIREQPPSPPGDSSDSVASPASPNANSDMDIEPAMTPATPPNRASASPTALPGSITPRQKQLWSQLLRDGLSDGPSELAMSNLRLTSAVKTSSQKIASLTRSASDIPQTSHARRKRLIDTLKSTTPISEADEMDVDSSSELGSEGSPAIQPVNVIGSNPPKLRTDVSFKKTSTRFTYGRGRTYLEEKNEEVLWDMLAAEEPSQTFSGNNPQSQVIIDDDMDMDGGSQLRAAHDLRVAGSRKRLHDELSMFIMDVEETSNSLPIRRSALRDLAVKLTEKEAAKCFVETGLDSTFLNAVEKDTDAVFLFLNAAIVVLLVVADPTSSMLDHVFHSQTFSNLFKLLNLNMSLEKIVRDRKSNLAKMTQTMILDFRDLLYASDIWGQARPRSLTPRVIGLQAIELVVRKLREHGSSHTLLDESTVKNILEIAKLELTNTSPDVVVIELAMSALQVNTVTTPTTRHKIWPPSLTQAFADILPALLALSEDTAALSVHLALKLAVELTNHNVVACDVIGTSGTIKLLLHNANKRYTQLLDHQAGERFNVALDFSVLSFGLTINLTEASNKARLAMLNDGGVSLSEAIRLFVRGKKRAEDAESLEDTQMNVIYGCLAFTLGNLSRSPATRKAVASQFPNGNLSVVLDAMQEFAAINQLTDKKEFEGEEGHEVSKSFTERLQTVLEEVKALNV
jgi:hypothetical protein